MGRRRRAPVVDSGSLVVDYAAVATTLVVDAAKAEVQAIGATDDYERRTYARALFALIDGVTYAQRQLAEHDARLPTQARARGKAAAKHARRIGRKAGDKESVALAVRAAFAAMSAAHQVPNPLVAGGDTWRSFRQAIAIRNRVTHPKTGMDCAVADSDLSLLRRVHHWYYDVSSALLERLTRAGRGSPPSNRMPVTSDAQATDAGS